MTEIDLIPDDYRKYLHLRWMIRSYIIFLSVLVLSVAIGRGWATYLIKAEENMIEKLKADENLILKQSKQIDNLKTQKSHVEVLLEALDALQKGPSAEQLFVTMSRTINHLTWITLWKFVRVDEANEKESAYRKIGNFLGKSKSENEKEPWRKQTYMEISGETLNHSALADFVIKLLEQPIIDGVHELKTWTSKQNTSMVVEYSLAVTITSRRPG